MEGGRGGGVGLVVTWVGWDRRPSHPRTARAPPDVNKHDNTVSIPPQTSLVSHSDVLHINKAEVIHPAEYSLELQSSYVALNSITLLLLVDTMSEYDFQKKNYRTLKIDFTGSKLLCMFQ